MVVPDDVGEICDGIGEICDGVGEICVVCLSSGMIGGDGIGEICDSVDEIHVVCLSSGMIGSDGIGEIGQLVLDRGQLLEDGVSFSHSWNVGQTCGLLHDNIQIS